MQADTAFRDPMRSLVEALVEGHFDQLEWDGRRGSLPPVRVRKR
jgi:hypothetical protein